MIYSPKQLSFSSDSLGDPFGRVFMLEGRVCRLIQKSAINECREFLNSELFEVLTKNGFIPKTTIVSDFEVEGAEMILEHERLFETKPHEWSFRMLQDVTSFVLKLNNICNHYGYELKDAHPHNFMFKDGHPVMIDIGSFQKKSIVWPANEEFIHTLYLPLLLWSKGEMYLERLIIESDNYPFRISPFQSPKDNEYIQSVLKPITEYSVRCIHYIHTNNAFFFSTARRINTLFATIKRKDDFQFFKLRRTYKMLSIESINQLTPPQLDIKRFSDPSNCMERIQSFVSELYCTNNHSCLFIGDSSIPLVSWIEELVSGQVIVLDRSSNNIDSIYYHFRTRNSVIPVLSSLINPPSVSSFVNRLSSEVVIVYGAMENYLKEGFLLSAILERICSLTEKQVFVCTDLSRISIEKEDFQREFSRYFTPLHIELEDNFLFYAGIKE